MMNKVAVSVAVALLVAFVSSASADEDCMKKIEAYRDKCKADLKLSKDDDIYGLDTKPDSAITNGTKCLIKCIAESMEVYKNGTVNQIKVLSMIEDMAKKAPENRERDMAILKECKDIVDPCPCETAWKISVCVRETSKKFVMGAMKKI